MVTAYQAVGQGVTRAEGPDKVSGKAIYAADIVLPEMLWARSSAAPSPTPG